MKINKHLIICIIASIIAMIGLVGAIIAISISSKYNEYKKYLIEPNSSQEEMMSLCEKYNYETYVVMPYSKNYETAEEMYKNLKELKKEYGIGFFLIDFDKYQKALIESWGLEKMPTYYVFTYNGEKINYLYNSYGVKAVEDLNKEITQVITYDLENDMTGIKYTKELVEETAYIYLKSVKVSEDKKNATLTFTVMVDYVFENPILFKPEQFIICDYMTKEIQINAKTTSITELEPIPQTRDITVTVEKPEDKEISFSNISIQYNFTDTKYFIWHYNIWTN